MMTSYGPTILLVVLLASGFGLVAQALNSTTPGTTEFNITTPESGSTTAEAPSTTAPPMVTTSATTGTTNNKTDTTKQVTTGTTAGPTTATGEPTTAATTTPTTALPTTRLGPTVPGTATTPPKATVTTTPPNVTTEGANATEPTTNRPSTPPPTTPPSPFTWNVVGRDNQTCIKMHLRANFTISYHTTDGSLENATVPLPQSANATGDCSSQDQRQFSLQFLGGSEPWTIQLIFITNKESTTYQLTSVTVELSYNDLSDSRDKGPHTYNFVSKESPLAGIFAPTGNAFTCGSVQIDSAGVEELSVALSDLRIQPFAEKAGGDFGKDVNCPYKPPTPPVPTKPMEEQNPWMFIGIAFICLSAVLLLVTAAGCWYVKKRKPKASDTYNLVETY